MKSYNCFKCSKVTPIVNEPSDKCPLCGGSNGEVIDGQRLKEGLESGVFYNLDPKTGKRAKK